MYEVIPGILEKEWTEIERKIELVKSFAKIIHIDIIDGKFAPNTTFLDTTPFKKYSPSAHSTGSGQAPFFEAHLMVEEPIQYLKPFADAGFKRFIGHIEKMSDQEEFVAQGQMLGEVGLAIDGPTPIDAIKVPYEDLDCILVYTSEHVGFSGPEFKEDRLLKIKAIREKNKSLPIEVDGGINDRTILLAKNAGATRFVTTSFLFGGDPLSNFNFLHKNLTNKLIV